MPASIKPVRAITLLFAASSAAASAAQLDYTLYTGIEHSDNIALTTTNQISQNVFTPGLTFTFDQQGSTIQANATGVLEYRDFLGRSISNQTQAQLAGQANWTIAPERLDLTIQDYAGIEPVNTLISNAPSNEQQTNVFALGPTLHFNLGSALRGQAELRYIDSYAQKNNDFDSQRGSAALRVLEDLSPTDQLSANIESQHTDFSNSDNSNYTRNELFGGYVRKLAHIDFNVALGWSQLDFEQGGTRNASSPLARLTLNWYSTSRSTITLAAVYEYTDAAQAMLSEPGQLISEPGRTINIGNAVINSQVYLDRHLQLTYGFRTERVTLSIAPIYSKLDYINDPSFNQTQRGGTLNLDYRLRPTLTLSAFANAERLVYNNLSRRDNTYNYGIDLSQQWTPHWSWRASLLHQRTSSTALNASFSENEIYLGVVFRR